MRLALLTGWVCCGIQALALLAVLNPWHPIGRDHQMNILPALARLFLPYTLLTFGLLLRGQLSQSPIPSFLGAALAVAPFLYVAFRML